MVGEEGSEVGLHPDWAHSGPASTVGDGERLVEVEVGDVRPELREAGDAHQGVQVGPVHVHLAAVAVNDVADLDDALFEDAVGGRVGHHECRQGVRMLLGLGFQVIDVDVPFVVAGDHHHLHPRHRRRRCEDEQLEAPAEPIQQPARTTVRHDEGMRQTVRCSSPRLRW